MIKRYAFALVALLLPLAASAQQPSVSVTGEQARETLMLQGATDYIMSVQRQQKEIEDLKKQVDDLKKQIPAKSEEKK